MKKLLVNYSEIFPGLEKKPHSYQVLADNFEWENRDVVKHGVERRYDEFQTFLSDHIGQESGKLIVECGCGLGTNLLPFKEKNLCLGVDFSRVALSKVHSFTNKIKVAQGDGSRLPVRSNCADYVILARVLFVHEDLHVIETMVEEAERILKPGGKVIIVNDYCNWGIEIFRSVSELSNRVVKMVFEPSVQRSKEFMCYYFSRKDLNAFLNRANFKNRTFHLCNIHEGVYHLTYHNPFLALLFRNIRKHKEVRSQSRHVKVSLAKNINDVYPLSWIGSLFRILVEKWCPDFAALSLCCVSTKRVEKEMPEDEVF